MKRLLAMTAGAVVAVTLTAGVAGAQTTPRLDQLKQRGDTEIQRRLDTLHADSTLVAGATHLADGDRTQLTAIITHDSDGLRALKTKVDGETQLAPLVDDLRSVVDDYRVYVLVEPQVHLTVAADRGLAIVGFFDDIAPKLQHAIDTAKANGKDTTAAQAALDDLKAKVADASTQASGVPGAVLPLTPAGYPGNVDTLRTARSSIGTARDDLKAARADAATVVTALR